MNDELDEMLDVLAGRIYVVVTWKVDQKTNIGTVEKVSERMSFEDAHLAWRTSGCTTDHVAYYGDIRYHIYNLRTVVSGFEKQ